MDCSSNSKCSKAEFVFICPEERPICYALKLNFPATNNDAEYEAVIAGLELALEIGVSSLCLHSDSQLIVNQILGEFQIRGERLTAYLKKTKLLLNQLDHYLIKRIPREKNQEADELAKQASMKDGTAS